MLDLSNPSKIRKKDLLQVAKSNPQAIKRLTIFFKIKNRRLFGKTNC